MDESKLLKIKSAIRANFDSGPEAYVAFERKHKFFYGLNSLLMEPVILPQNASILDVGCGTGAGCQQLLHTFPGSSIVGIDNSSAMLQFASAAIKDSLEITLIHGDAGHLTTILNQTFDAVVYSASIFLIPDYRESLRQAHELMNSPGHIALSFMDGVFDASGRNVFAEIDKATGLGVSFKKAVKWDEFVRLFTEQFPKHQIREHYFNVSTEFLRDFFSVPAMSAGLFPGLGYPERLQLVEKLVGSIGEANSRFKWMLVNGKKN
jgi:cyclopropane-fatty-acyl-phospholipid synthase